MALAPYTRVKVQGKTVNARTAAYFKQVVHMYHMMGGTGDVLIWQGSYNKGVTASAGTHDGGGALDLGLTRQTSRNWNKLEKAARICMGAAWLRTPAQGFDYHVHIEVIGDKEMSNAGRRQVSDYYAGRNGLANHAFDPRSKWRPSNLFPMSYPLPVVDLSVVLTEAKKTKGYVAKPGVKRVQQALNLKLGDDLKVDGIFGKATKAAYKRYEASMLGTDSKSVDGLPGSFTLTLLGGGRFNIQA